MMSDRNEKGDEMSDRMSRRFGGESGSKTEEQPGQSGETAQQPQHSKSDMNSKTDMKSQTAENGVTISSSQTVKDLKSVLMYLPDVQKQRLDREFKRLDLEFDAEHGIELEKNRHFYPAAVEAMLTERSVEEVLHEALVEK